MLKGDWPLCNALVCALLQSKVCSQQTDFPDHRRPVLRTGIFHTAFSHLDIRYIRMYISVFCLTGISEYGGLETGSTEPPAAN